MNEFDRGYCVGLFEGEGHIGSQVGTVLNRYPDGKQYKTPRRKIYLKIAMTDLQPLELFQESFGVGTIYGPWSNGPGRKDYYQYSLHNFEKIQYVVCYLWEFLSPRRKEQIEKAFKAYTSYSLRNRPKIKEREVGC